MATANDFILVPRPREFEITGPGCEATAPLRTEHDDSLPAQGFEFTVNERGPLLRYSDDAGERYGRALAAQLRDQLDGGWPGLRVADRPDFPIRGYMLDISRGRVPTRDTLSRLVEVLDLLRVNHLQLYTEHTFAYRDHEVVWRDASPLTPEDVTWLDELCAEHGIELAANQNCFAHMEHWLKHDGYRHRAELPEGFELMGAHRPATTLAPTQDNADFVLGLLEELLPHFRSSRVNIGGDETWELGKGASAAEAAERGLGRVYLDQLRRIADPLLEQGRKVQFWGDIISHYPELVPELPEGGYAVAWDYEAPWPADRIERLMSEVGQPFAESGVDLAGKLDGFDSTVAPFRDAGYPFWVAPGTTTWRSLIGRLDNAYGNLADTIGVGAESGAGGVLITDWGDAGHLQPPSVSLPPLVYGAALSWCHGSNADIDVPGILDRFVFGGKGFGDILDTLGRAAERTGQLAFNASPLQLALESRRAVVAGEPDARQVADVIDDLNAQLDELAGAQGTATDIESVRAELIAATRLARHGAWRLLRRAGAPAPGDAALRVDLNAAMTLHREAWALRSRPGGIEFGLETLRTLAAGY